MHSEYVWRAFEKMKRHNYPKQIIAIIDHISRDAIKIKISIFLDDGGNIIK